MSRDLSPVRIELIYACCQRQSHCGMQICGISASAASAPTAAANSISVRKVKQWTGCRRLALELGYSDAVSFEEAVEQYRADAADAVDALITQKRSCIYFRRCNKVCCHFGLQRQTYHLDYREVCHLYRMTRLCCIKA